MGGTTHIHLLGYQTKKIKSHEVGRGHVESDLEEFQGDVEVRYDHISFYTLKFSKNDFFKKERNKERMLTEYELTTESTNSFPPWFRLQVPS